MSVLNEMLRDLEQRQAPDRGNAAETAGYGQLAADKSSLGNKIIAVAVGCIGAALIAVGGWIYLADKSDISVPLAQSGEIDRAGQFAQTSPAPLSVTQSRTPSEVAPGIKEQGANDTTTMAQRQHKTAANSEQSGTSVAPVTKAADPVKRTAQPKQVSPESDSQVSGATATSVSGQTPDQQQPVAETPSVVAEKRVTIANTLVAKRSGTEQSDTRPTSAKQATVSDSGKVVAEADSTPDRMSKTLVVTAEQKDERAARDAGRKYRQGKATQAEQELQQYIVDNPVHPQALRTLAYIYFSEARWSELSALLTQSRIASDPYLRQLAAREMLNRNDLDGAVQLLSSKPPPVAENPDYYSLLGLLYQQQGAGDEAVAIYAELLRVDDSRADWWVGLAISLEAGQQVEGARRAYTEALALETINAELASFARQRLTQLGS